MNCPGCGAVNNSDSISCVACNRTLLIVCPQCTARNHINAAICAQCGRIINEQNDPQLAQQKSGDPVAEMYFEPVLDATDESFPKNAILRVILGSFIFALLYMSQIFSGYPMLLLAGGLLSGIIALWGLIDITFWVIEDNEINQEPQDEKLPEHYPTDLEGGLPNIGLSFEDIDIEHRASSKVASQSQSDDLAEGAEVSPTPAEEAQVKPQKFETLAEFLSNGIEKEIESVKGKIKRSPDNYALLMRLAQLHEERGETDAALETIIECVKHQPEIAEVYLYYGILLKNNNEFSAAKEAFFRALELNRFMSKAFYQLGTLERGLNNLPEARNFLQKCIQLSPDDPYAHYQLGMIYRDMGESGLAIMELKRATILHPSDSYGHSRLGQVYQQTRQLNEAIYSYSQALSIKPDDAFVLEKLAEVVAEKGSYDKAARLFQEAISKQVQPKVETMLSLAQTLRKLEDYEQLEQLVDEIIRLEPENHKAILLKAMVEIKANRPEQAIVLLEKVTASATADYEAWLELGKLYQSQNQHEKALSALTRASTTAPDQAGIWNNIGILLSNQKAYEEAVKAFRKAASFDFSDAQISANLRSVQKKLDASCVRIIENRTEQLEKNPQDLDAYLEMGHAYEVLQRPDNALMAYQRLLAIQPDHVPGLMNYAELLRKRGKLKMAMRCYREIIKLQPENFDTHLYLVQANLNLGFLNEALRHAVIAQKINTDDPRVRFLLGKIYFAKGLAPRALKEFAFVAENSLSPDMISWAELMRKRLARTNKH